jgi:hypothetical protein
MPVRGGDDSMGIILITTGGDGRSIFLGRQGGESRQHEHTDNEDGESNRRNTQEESGKLKGEAIRRMARVRVLMSKRPPPRLRRGGIRI